MRCLGWVLVTLWLPGVAWGQNVLADAPSLASTIAGRVCRDLDGDGRCGPDEPGVPDVRLVLTTGRDVRTDARGRFHLVGVDARVPDATDGLHLRPGRHRLRVDSRTLPAATRVSPEAATVEVPWGAVVLQDFVVRDIAADAVPVVQTYAVAPPVAELVAGADAVRFRVAGEAGVGSQVVVAGVKAEVDAQGRWRALVPLVEGANVLPITATAADGVVSLFRQPIDVVRREGGWLVAPRTMEPVGSLRLPGTHDAPVASGVTKLRVQVPAGTRVRSGDTDVVVGPEGSAEVPVKLVPGSNRVSLTLQSKDQPPREEPLEIVAASRPFAVALLDLEASVPLGDGDVQLRGRGSAHAEAQVGPVQVVRAIDLRDTDVRLLRGRELPDWFRPRVPERFDRAADPDLTPAEWGDDSISLTPNPAEGRLRVEARHDVYGRAGVGTYRALMQESEVGRYHRPLFGPYADLKTDVGPGGLQAGVEAFGGSLSDPTRRLAAVPAHEELRATGGSLYYLGATSVAEGSELVRVEVREGVTGLPLGERHLVRGVDYDIDYFSGRILLARPLSFLAREASRRSSRALTESPEPVLVVDYAALQVADAQDSAGGRLWATWERLRLAVGAVREGREGKPYTLYSGYASATLGRFTLLAEAASSRGSAVQSGLFGVSDDGGLTFLRPLSQTDGRGEALSVRLLTDKTASGGSVDAAFRVRGAGFSDGAHSDAALFRQFSLRAEQPVGPVRLTLMGDDRRSADPRLPFSDAPFSSRTLGVGMGYEQGPWGVSIEARDSRLRASEVAGVGPELEGGRTSVGIAGSWKVAPSLVLRVAQRVAVHQRGAGPGRFDDTFTSAGADVDVGDDTRVAVRGGWGPKLGPQAWGNVETSRGPDVFYGGYSVDVDGPDFGMGRTVTGASTNVDDGTALFVEDIGAHDATAVRLSRAVGLQRQVFGGFSVGARYERGVRSLLDVKSPLSRDAGGVFAQFVRERVKLEGRAELRHERGTPERGALAPVDRTQVVVALAAEAALLEDVTASGRVDFARTAGEAGLESRLVEGYAAVAWRPGPWLVVARYGLTRELLPGTRSAFGERAVQILSLLPAVHLGDRFAVAAGLHAARSSLASSARWVWTGTLRPSVRVVGGLEVAAEVARRTASPEDERLSALRAEVAYRLDERFRIAGGYTLLGFRGLGLTGEPSDDQDRLYVRAEVAW